MILNTERLRRDRVVIGGSAGSMEVVEEILQGLPPGLPASVVIALHMSPDFPSRLAEILGRRSQLPVFVSGNGQPLAEGRVFVAVPDHHVIFSAAGLELTRSAKEHFTRPAIDVLFRSAAATLGPRVVGVLLSGGGYDGTLGLMAIKAAGGISLVQDPATARHAGMLRSAVRYAGPDAVMSVSQIAEILPRLAAGEAVDSGTG